MQAYPQPNLPPRRPQHNNIWLWVITGSVTAGFLMMMAVIGLLLLLYAGKDRLPAGVKIGGVDVGGKSRPEVPAYLSKTLLNQNIALTDGARSWAVSLTQFGVSIDTKATLKALENARAGQNVQPFYNINLNQTQDALVALSDQVNIPAAPGNIGRAVEIPVVLSRLYTDVTGELADGVLELNMIDIAPPEPEPLSTSYTGAKTTHIVERGQELALIARMYGVAMNDIVTLNNISNPDLLYVGQQLIIPAAGLYVPGAAEAPPAPLSSGKSIVVDTRTQRIYAYENGQLVYARLTSTGRPETPTVLGDYKIYVKYEADDMAGADYFLPQVPYVMYFYRGYGIHGTYWHNSFGRPMSHGCVNLPVDQAKWFFDWAQVGTVVRVI